MSSFFKCNHCCGYLKGHTRYASESLCEESIDRVRYTIEILSKGVE